MKIIFIILCIALFACNKKENTQTTNSNVFLVGYGVIDTNDLKTVLKYVPCFPNCTDTVYKNRIVFVHDTIYKNKVSLNSSNQTGGQTAIEINN